jgi:N-acetylneuraminate synthase
MGDASGVNGEGLQIGKGDIDFKKLSIILNQNCPNAAFIPEIWQGHKNRGEGFWIGLNKLEGLL